MSIGTSPRVRSFLRSHAAAQQSIPTLRYHLAAVVLLVTVAVLRLLFLCSTTDFSLSTDEAHYWDWSRQLDWCYYSKGPLVAWLIRASCWLWGSDVMPAVRLPAILCNAFTLLGIYLLMYRIFRDARLAFMALLAAHTLPFLHVGGLLMTIDAPYTCAWTWAVLLAHVVLFPRVEASSKEPGASRRQLLLWSAMGLIVAVGVLAKHNMAMFVPSLGLFLLLSPDHRRELFRPGFWLMALIGGVIGGGPILWWNAHHHWVTFLHVGTQAAGQQATGLRWLGPVEFFGTQAALMMGLWFLLMVIGFVQVVRHWYTSPKRERGWAARSSVSPKQQEDLPSPPGTSSLTLRVGVPQQQLFLTCLALPMLLVCLVFSFKTRIEPNWPITAYITGLVLAGWMLWERWGSRAWRRWTVGICIAGFVFSLFIHDTAVLYPLHARFFPETSPRRWDPTCRLKGWDTLADAVDGLRSKEPAALLLGSNYSYTAALAFHLKGQPTVYSLGPVGGSRHSQYDLWRPNPLHDPEQFVGRDAIIVGDITPQIRAAFEVVEKSQVVKATQLGLVIAEWNVTVARK
ncbi:MAG TPA: glycosyltransferase family 39 protein, partial [Gemmatales bacterium]|nr:glycosyltransferase family 39 protein [Gemmatales bacterium]